MKLLATLVLLAASLSAQTIEVKRPSFELDAGATVKCGFGTKQTSPNMPSAYDAAGQSTSSSIVAQGTISQSLYSSHQFLSWQQPSAAYTSLTLEVVSQAVETNQTGSVGQMALRYSADSGTTWNTILSSSSDGWAKQTSTIILSAGQDLSKLKVAVCVESTAGGDTAGPRETLTVYDIWTEGQVTGQPAGPGSSSGQPHRGAVIVN